MLTDKCEDSFIEQIFKDITNQQEPENNIKSNSKSKSNSVSNSVEIESTTNNDVEENDQQFEHYLRKSLKENLSLEEIPKEKLKENQEFQACKMKLYNTKRKKFISTKPYYCDKKYYWINDGEKYFIIKKGDFSTLYYCDYKTKEYKIIRGIEESQQNDAKLILRKNENVPEPKTEQKDDKLIQPKNCDKKDLVPKNEEKEESKLIKEEDKTADKKEPKKEDLEEDMFLHEIKLNLLSKNTVSVVGENNNIPTDIFERYYVEAILMTKGNDEPYALYLGKGKDNNPDNGNIHFIMDNYYVKFTVIKGQYDGAYINPTKINLKSFGCKIVCNTFDEIKENSNVLFEFKNGKGGEKKVISQAKRYQESAKIIFGENSFYHIIIVRENLGDILAKRMNKLQKFKNFALLKLDNTQKIFGKPLNPFKGKSKTGKSPQKSAKSFKTTDSKKNAPIKQQDFNIKIKTLKGEIMGEMNKKMDSFKEEIKKEMDNKMDTFKKEIKKEMNDFKEEIKSDIKATMNENFNQIMAKINELFKAKNSSKKYNSAESTKNRIVINQNLV